MSVKTNYEKIFKYYEDLEMECTSVNGLKEFITVLSKPKKDAVIVSSSRLIRGIAKAVGLGRINPASNLEFIDQYFALKEAFSLLNKKNVPVYFFCRVGSLSTKDLYSKSELRRMKKEIDFPKIYEAIDEYEDDLKDIFGERYSADYIRKIGSIPQIVRKGGVYCHEDYKSEYLNVINGKRIVTDCPEDYKLTLHVYGRCGAFGYAVEDRDTLPSQLQKKLIDNGHKDIRVINEGLWGASDDYLDYNFLSECTGFTEKDIVVFYRMPFDERVLQKFTERGVYFEDITSEWHKRRDNRVTFFNQPGHMNAEGYGLAADIICEKLMNSDFKGGNGSIFEDTIDASLLNKYLKERKDLEFEREIKKYIEDILLKYPLSSNDMHNGAIVMNCNPFTYGHRYLIEKAASQVDRLYIFVVEENKSFFSFDDRFEMVKKGVSDLTNIIVIPSGKFIISTFTFPEYFMKDYVKKKDFDVSMDVETFCKYIAPPLDIKVRFAGEEPFDPVTKNYNDNMHIILPQYNMEFVEIKRLAIDSERIINATKVRKLLKEKSVDELKEYVPDSTYQILINKYI